jgi:hypothetical protein
MGDYREKNCLLLFRQNAPIAADQIEIALDSELNIKNVTHGSDPMFCLPIVTLANTKEPSIVDIF